MAKPFTARSTGSIVAYALVSGFGLSWLILLVMVPMLTTPFSLGSFANFPFGLDWAYIINLFFQLLITVLILFAVSHNGLDLITKAGHREVKVREGPKVTRFDLNQRIQHVWLFVTMTILAITGFAQMDYESWGRLVIVPMGGLAVSMDVHLLAAFFLGLIIVYHFTYYTAQYLVQRARGEHPGLPIMMGMAMIKEFFQNMKYMLGRGEAPEFGKYDYAQKFDYWGIYWGTTILVAPGVILWIFGSTAFGGLPFIFHTDEAMLAVLFLFVFHFYQTHFNPKAFPVSGVFLSGTLTEGEMRDEHLLELERIKGGGR